jgi:two-component system sensor histidine kinase/response regulator
MRRKLNGTKSKDREPRVARPEEAIYTLPIMMKHTILCVDDEVDNVEALERLFRKKYKVLKATSGPMALELLDQHPHEVTVIITDQRMPLMTGVQMLEKAVEKHPGPQRLLLTGYTDLESVIEAVNKGQIHRYLTKPWDPVDLQQTVDQAVERFNLTEELKNKNLALEKALSELKTLDQAKSQFMILINHELKTPLTSILNFLGLLAETSLDEDQVRYLSRIEKSADRLQELVNDVLLLMRAETGQIRPQTGEVRIPQIIQDVEPKLRDLILKKQQKISLQLELDTVRTDLFILKEVLHRLIHNAARFAPEATLIEIRSQSVGSALQIFIENKGSSFNLEMTKKLLQPFTLDENILHHSTGTGLGLAICQSLLKRLNSELKLENTPTGACVSFHLES